MAVIFRIEKADGVRHLPGGGPLVAYLHGAPAGALKRRAHFLGVRHRERHGLFLVDVLAGVERGREVLRVEVLGCGHQHGVDALVVQQGAVIVIGLGARRNAPGLVEPLAIHIGGADALDVVAAHGFEQDLLAALARPDDADAYALARAEHVGSRQRAGQTGSHFADEIPARLHETDSLPNGAAALGATSIIAWANSRSAGAL